MSKKSWANKTKKPITTHDMIPKWFLEAKKKNVSDEQLRILISENLSKTSTDYTDANVEFFLILNNELYGK